MMIVQTEWKCLKREVACCVCLRSWNVNEHGEYLVLRWQGSCIHVFRLKMQTWEPSGEKVLQIEVVSIMMGLHRDIC